VSPIRQWLYLSSPDALEISDDKINNLVIQDVGAEEDTITNLRAPTHFGRPNVSHLVSPVECSN